MSTTTLEGLRDYLYSTLSPANMLWLSTQLADYAKQLEGSALKRYTLEELNAMLDQSDADIAAGRTIPDEEMWRGYDEERAREEELELVKAV